LSAKDVAITSHRSLPGTHIAPAAPIPVKRLQFLPPRIEDEAGFIDESIRFVAQSSEHTLTFSLVCKEKGFAYIGAGVGDKLPEEYFSLCQPMPTKTQEQQDRF
jgi:hypothetical protein